MPLVDIRPLRVSRDFRRLWTGQAVSFLGSTMTTAAMPFQVFHQTGSSLAVGALGAVQLGPLLVGSLYGGALADRIDKRSLLLIVTVSSALTSAALAFNASLSHPQLWVVYLLAAFVSAIGAVTFPALRSLLQLLVEPELRPAAFGLQSIYFSFGAMVGPALAGLIIAVFSLKATYTIDAVSYAFALLFFARLAPSPPVAVHTGSSHASVIEGLKFLRGQPVIMSIFGIDLIAMIFGMPRALFPQLAQNLGGGAGLYGLLVSSVAVGSFVAATTSGLWTRSQRHGLVVIWAVGCWGAAVALAGLAKQPVVVLVLFAFAGAADTVSAVYRSTIAADVTPDELRGRVSGVEIAVYAGGPVLGDIEAGVVGGIAGVPFAIVSGGLACVAGALWFARFVPEFAHYRRRGPATATT
jgi:MFS family permease